MEDRFIAFDVETPNYDNDRMSAIGISIIENGAVQEDFYSLVDPEVRFDSFNTQLTGISAKTVRGQPTFPELWEKICPIMDSGLLIAHNAHFDMSVLAKCLRGYGLNWHPTVHYACTCQMSRRTLPGLPNYKLDTLCRQLHLTLNHHQADSDARACGEILLHCLRSDADIHRFIRTYDMVQIRTKR